MASEEISKTPENVNVEDLVVCQTEILKNSKNEEPETPIKIEKGSKSTTGNITEITIKSEDSLRLKGGTEKSLEKEIEERDGYPEPLRLRGGKGSTIEMDDSDKEEGAKPAVKEEIKHCFTVDEKNEDIKTDGCLEEIEQINQALTYILEQVGHERKMGDGFIDKEERVVMSQEEKNKIIREIVYEVFSEMAIQEFYGKSEEDKIEEEETTKQKNNEKQNISEKEDKVEKRVRFATSEPIEEYEEICETYRLNEIEEPKETKVNLLCYLTEENSNSEFVQHMENKLKEFDNKLWQIVKSNKWSEETIIEEENETLKVESELKEITEYPEPYMCEECFLLEGQKICDNCRHTNQESNEVKVETVKNNITENQAGQDKKEYGDAEVGSNIVNIGQPEEGQDVGVTERCEGKEETIKEIAEYPESYMCEKCLLLEGQNICDDCRQKNQESNEVKYKIKVNKISEKQDVGVTPGQILQAWQIRQADRDGQAWVSCQTIKERRRVRVGLAEFAELGKQINNFEESCLCKGAREKWQKWQETKKIIQKEENGSIDGKVSPRRCRCVKV